MQQDAPHKDKTATETFEMWRNAYGEECLSRTSVFEWHIRFEERREFFKTVNGKAVLQLPEQTN
jgi:hypothetical protein